MKSNKMHLRTPESIKRKLDAMLKKNETITIDHGVSVYEFDHYDYEAPSVYNKFESMITIWVKDFDPAHTPIVYMQLREDDLRSPNKNDWGIDLITCVWETAWPMCLYIREYSVGY